MHLGHISQTLHSMCWKEIKSISPPPDPRLPYRPGDPSPCVRRRRTTFKGILIISQGDVIKYCKHVLNESMSQRLQSVYRIKNLKAPKWDKTGEGEGKRERLKIKRKRKCLCDQRVDLKMYTKVKVAPWGALTTEERRMESLWFKGPPSRFPGSWQTSLIHHTHHPLWIYNRQTSLINHTNLALWIHIWQISLIDHTHLALWFASGRHCSSVTPILASEFIPDLRILGNKEIQSSNLNCSLNSLIFLFVKGPGILLWSPWYCTITRRLIGQDEMSTLSWLNIAFFVILLCIGVYSQVQETRYSEVCID